MMTACPQCDRLVDGAKPRCLYCGALLPSAAEPPPAGRPDSDPAGSPSCAQTSPSTRIPSDEPETVSVNLQDLPPDLRSRVLEALRSRKTAAAAVEAPNPAPQPAQSLDAVLAAIRQLKNGFDADRLDYDEYRSLVVDTLMQYVETLPARDRMNFVFQELPQTDCAAFVDEAVFKALSGRVLAAATQQFRQESAAPGKKKRKRFRLFRR